MRTQPYPGRARRAYNACMTGSPSHPRQQNRAPNAHAGGFANAPACQSARSEPWIATPQVHVLERSGQKKRVTLSPTFWGRGQGEGVPQKRASNPKPRRINDSHQCRACQIDIGTPSPRPLPRFAGAREKWGTPPSKNPKTIMLPKFRQAIARADKTRFPSNTSVLRILRGGPRGYPPSVFCRTIMLSNIPARREQNYSGISPIYAELGRSSRPRRCCSRACAVQPAARAVAKIGVKAWRGIASASSRIAVKNSTLVSSG